MRKCPECETELVEEDLYGEVIDRCKNCNGIFFDEGELENISEIVSLYEEISLNEDEVITVDSYEKDRILLCPVDNKQMEKFDIAGIILDRCPECNGIWLDNEEIIILKAAENHIKGHLNLYIKLGE